jgi:hypothetical protein
MTLRQHLTASPALYPLALDPRADAVQLVYLKPADYAAASFLDARMLAPGTLKATTPWAEIREAAAGLPQRCHFIFHISHVGSTLLSRLLGLHPSLFSLREPAILRYLADTHLTLDQPPCPWTRAEYEERLGIYLGLWSRTFERGQTALVKATSFVSEMAEHLLARVGDARAIFMFLSPAEFLRAVLGRAMVDIEDLAGKRLARAHGRLGGERWQLERLSPGERVAMSWLCEMLALHAAAARFPSRVRWLDFDRFLAQPERELSGALRHLGVDAGGETVRRLLAGPTMRQYAKAPEHAFDAARREQILREAQRQQAEEIHKGLQWLAGVARASPAAQAVLESHAP